MVSDFFKHMNLSNGGGYLLTHTKLCSPAFFIKTDKFQLPVNPTGTNVQCEQKVTTLCSLFDTQQFVKTLSITFFSSTKKFCSIQLGRDCSADAITQGPLDDGLTDFEFQFYQAAKESCLFLLQDDL